MKLHTQFLVVKNLKEGEMKIEQKIAYAKVRMGLREREERAEDSDVDMEMMTKEELEARETLRKMHNAYAEEREELIEEEEAKTRQTYDPWKREYDDKNPRVTYIKDCSRVTLPKPLM